MSSANPLWGAPRIHGELLELGIEIGQATVAKYMMRGRDAPSLTWHMLQRRALAAGILTAVVTTPATGITAYLDNCGSLENAQAVAAHEGPRKTGYTIVRTTRSGSMG